MFLQFAVFPIAVAWAGTVPFVVNVETGTPVVSMTAGTIPYSPHKLYIGDRIIRHESDRELVLISNNEFRFEGSRVIPHVFNNLQYQVESDHVPRGDWLAIGPLSELVRTHTSTDYLSALSSIVLGSPEEDFIAQCLPESVARLPIASRSSVHAGEERAMNISVLGTIATSRGGVEVTFQFSPIDTVLEMDRETLSVLFPDGPLLLNSGGFVLLPPETADRFPPINILFHNTEEEAGDTLVLSPREIIDFDSGTTRIRLFNHTGDAAHPVIHFNPLLIPDINVRSTNLGLMIGKAINQRAPRPSTTAPTQIKRSKFED